MIDYNKALDKARQMAAKAKPGFIKIDSVLYTFVFDMNEWVYIVYADGVEYVRFNTKTLTSAKKYLKDYLEN